jgi:cytochrome c oxidase assembly protein subunit 15
MTNTKALPATMPTTQARRQVALWLLVCCAMVFAMVVVGGVTRLTHSGLSMVEWDPIMGAIPPLNLAQWTETFAKYQLTPEYLKVNQGMSLEEFKSIFWLEYYHRLLGRSIGIVFLLPFLYFLLRRRIQSTQAPKYIAMFVLGGLQGVLGWYMVKSGLKDNPHVSPYFLTAHLAAAFALYGYMFRVALGLLSPQPQHPGGSAIRRLSRYSRGVTTLIFIMVLSGGFVAGLKAGLAFNTFPTMNGHWLPPGLYALNPLWHNFFENLATVQFNHRMIAYLLAVAIPLFWWRAQTTPLPLRARRAIHLLPAMLVLQIGLGIATLLLIVPVPLAAAHQAGALVLFTLALFVNHELRTAQSAA